MEMKHHFIYRQTKLINDFVGANNGDELWTVLNVLEDVANISNSDNIMYMLTVCSQILCLLARADSLEEFERDLTNLKKYLEM